MRFEHSSISGVGVGLRTPHYHDILTTRPSVPWFEAITENYLGEKALPQHHLFKIREHYPITLHGVSLSVGSADPIDWDYLKWLKQLAKDLEAPFISDHLCWTGVNGRFIPDLLPLPYREDVIKHVVEKINQIQDFLGQQILLENVSRYIDFPGEMSECAFLSEVATRADCFILLDINNIYVNAKNHAFNEMAYLKAIPQDRVKQFHLAGFEDEKTHLLDSHGAPVSKPVWDLFKEAIDILGPLPTIIEWDNNLPTFERLLQESHFAKHLIEKPLIEKQAMEKQT